MICKRFRAAFAVLAWVLCAQGVHAATWDTRVQELAPGPGFCVTGLVAGVFQTSVCAQSTAIAVPFYMTAAWSATTGITLGFAGQSANTVLAGPAVGAAAPPGFRATACADLPAGVPCLLNTLTASNSAALSDTTSITSTYAEYEIVLSNLLPATGGANCEIQLYVGGAYKTTSYLALARASTAAATTTTAETTYIPCSGDTGGQSSLQGISGTFRVSAPSANSANVWGQIATEVSPPAVQLAEIAGAYTGTGAMSGFQVFFSSGNIASGKIKIYGRN